MRISTSPMYLVYVDADGNHHTQPWGDVVDSGTLTDPDTGDDMEIVGWSTERT
ncbi:MAG: hypothetical protein WAV90_00360 [Gordonia amarae]